MSRPIIKFAILGERCSGTNFLEECINHNFQINYTSEYGNKHFFCYNNYSNNTHDTLFIGIIRNPIYWLNSFSKELYHVPEINRKNLNNFLFNEFYSVKDELDNTNLSLTNNIFMKNDKYYTKQYDINNNDLNYLNGQKYKNIFELRKVKNHFLINVMPNKVNNYILINYEDLLFNFEAIMLTLKNKFNLIQKTVSFEKIKKYKKSETYNFVKQREILFTLKNVQLIWKNLYLEQENFLGYYPLNNNNFFKTKYQPNSDNIPFNEGKYKQLDGHLPIVSL
jgi:hypothetical protein